MQVAGTKYKVGLFLSRRRRPGVQGKSADEIVNFGLSKTGEPASDDGILNRSRRGKTTLSECRRP